MKTAMQELIEWLKEECDFLKNSDAVEDRFAASAFRNSFEKATELLEKEKEQIKDAYKRLHFPPPIDMNMEQSANNYYSKTYTNQTLKQ